MDYLQIAVEENDNTWKQRCNKKMEILKHRQLLSQDESSHLGLVQEKKIMNFKLYEAIVDDGDVDCFIDVLEQVLYADKVLHLSTIFDQVTMTGDSLLHITADLGREHIAELISHHFPELLIRRNIKGDTALHVAARSEKKSNIIKIILSQYMIKKSKHEMKDGEEITRLKNEYGDTALHVAVYSKHLNVITEILLADQPVAHHLNKSGKSPLYLSVLTGDMEILHLLLSIPLPANEPLLRCRGNSPLNAAISDRNPAFLKEILAIRPELIYFRDENGGTSLHYAAYIGYVEGIHILLEAPSQTALERNKKGHLPIHLACKMGHVDVVKKLLQQEWPNPRFLLNQKGQNVFHVAAKAGENIVVEYLLRNEKIDGTTINEQDVNGNTPLHLAARFFFTETLASLSRDKRTIMNVTNNKGLTALDIVLLTSHDSMTYRELLSRKILDSAGAHFSEKVLSMVRHSRQDDLKTDWGKGRFNTFMVVSILMTTVTFAAGFTLPGSVISSDDPNPHKRGMAVMVHKPMFQLFTICNTIAMYSSTAVCIVLMWLRFDDFNSGLRVTLYATRLLGVALVTTAVAFLAAMRLVVSEVSWLADVITIIATIFLLMIVLSYGSFTFPLVFDQPIMRDLSNHIFDIWNTRTSTKVIAKKRDKPNSKHVDKGKQEERSEGDNSVCGN